MMDMAGTAFGFGLGLFTALALVAAVIFGVTFLAFWIIEQFARAQQRRASQHNYIERQKAAAVHAARPGAGVVITHKTKVGAHRG